MGLELAKDSRVLLLLSWAKVCHRYADASKRTFVALHDH